MEKRFVFLHRKRKADIQNDNVFYFQSTHEAPTYGPFSPFQFESNAEKHQAYLLVATDSDIWIKTDLFTEGE